MPSGNLTQAASFIGPVLSTSSLTIGTGAQTFIIPSGMAFGVGSYVVASAGSSGWMAGTVTSYTAQSLLINVTATSGSGTYASWTLTGVPVPTPGAWTAVTFQNSWVNVSGQNACRYRLENDGVTVRLSGAATGGSPATIFTLPSGFRPAQTIHLNVWDSLNNSDMEVTVTTGGMMAGSTGTQPSFENVTFPIN